MKTTLKHHGRDDAVSPSAFTVRRMEVRDMRTTWTAFLVIVVLVAGGVGAQQQKQAEIELQAAIRTETVDGDLQGVIKQYGAIVAKHKENRTVAATALVRMAECHQKLGNAEARKIYEQVVRDYADQKEMVTIARARLGGPVAGSKGDRPVWTGPKVDLFGQVSPDGRFITYVDWGGGQNLIVHDLVNNSDRPLTTTGPSVGFTQWAEFSTISRDGKQVAYAWFNDKGRYDLRIVPLQGGAPSQPRQFFAGSDEIRSIAPVDWSPDGKWIAVNIRRKDGTGQIGLVAVADGSLRLLKSVDWRGANKILFSPDGRFIAYDLTPGDSDTARHVYVMAVDASRETAIVAHTSRNVVMAWTPDGQHVLFASDRSGETALWAQPVAEGRPQGPPTLIKRDIGSSVSLGLTNSGALYVYKSQSANYVQVAALDLNAGKVLSPPAAASFQQFVGSGGSPHWSPDGTYLAYRSCGAAPRAVCTIAIASVETGEVRELRPKLSYLGTLRWSADGRSFLTDGTDFKGTRALYRIDAQTGEISLMHARLGAITQWAPDEKKFYYRRGGSIVERDVATGTDRELFHEKATGNSVSIKVAPNGRNIAAVETTATATTLYVVPIDGGPPKELLRARAGEEFDGFRLDWTPDSRALVLPKRIQTGLELWLIPLTEGERTRKITVDAENWILPGGGFTIHPDGRRIAFVGAAGKQGAEVWALENFLPKLAGSN